MEITSQNFVSTFPLVRKSIETADFLAFDTEFSGKLPAPITFRPCNQLDRPRP